MILQEEFGFSSSAKCTNPLDYMGFYSTFDESVSLKRETMTTAKIARLPSRINPDLKEVLIRGYFGDISGTMAFQTIKNTVAWRP